jgi:hypothetical protein
MGAFRYLDVYLGASKAECLAVYWGARSMVATTVD